MLLPLLLLLLLSSKDLCFAAEVSSSSYITWDDLTVNAGALSLNDGNAVRVIVVDKKGTGDSITVQGAVDMVPYYNSERVKIHILPGVYSEKVHIPATKPYISLIGNPAQPTSTLITWHDKASDPGPYGGQMGTWNSSTVTVEADYFCATGITFENTVKIPYPGSEGYQAVAMRIAGDKSVFYKVVIKGYQDTLLDETGTHYFYKCVIQGTTDFIFGNGRSLYQECILYLVGYSYSIAAQKRISPDEDTGFSFVNCNIVGTGQIYLGRAWGEYSRVIYANCNINVNVLPIGWGDWGDPSRQRSVVFGEYECRGKGADRSGRAPWSKALSYEEAKWYLDRRFISGEAWLRL